MEYAMCGNLYCFYRETGKTAIVRGCDTTGFGALPDYEAPVLEVFWRESEDKVGDVRPAYQPEYGDKPCVWVMGAQGEIIRAAAPEYFQASES